ILGTLVGGAATIGTAQLAYLYGLSAWWFTLGAGIACLFLGLSLAPSLRRGMVATIPQFISRYHDERARVCASLFSALGMFIHILAQLLAGGALLSTLFGISLLGGALIALLLTALFTVGGGMRSAGPLGIIKVLLIYATMLTAGILAISRCGGLSSLERALPAFPWFSLFGYGVKEGLADFCSLLVGVISTQTYLQAIFSARDTAAARNGALISALLMPPLGLLAIAIGLFMRLHAPGIDSAKALPLFLAQQFPPALAGIAFAALLITAVGTAAGLAMGVGTTLYVDVVSKLKRAQAHELLLMRLLTLGALLASFGILLFNLDSAIMKWSFLSMGLRGATLCLPLLLAIFLHERTTAWGGALSIFTAPVAVIIAGVCSSPLPPLYVGLAVSCAAILAGFARQRFSSSTYK
ncbi:MAG: sodium:solute symporter family protein, partial [Desulfuromonadales bacterium]|nr:sodium:solute symporter family protein [Desulfuromonadales bacterium]